MRKLVGTNNFELRETRTLYGESGLPLSEHGKSICPPLRRAPCNLIPNTKVTEWIYLDDLPVAQVTNLQISYLETDHLGTPRLAANPVTNAMQWQWSFFGSAFGDHQPTWASGGSLDVRLRYPGQQYDIETGLHYNYFRDYEPGTGRYIESDPIGLSGGISTYAYVESDLIRFADASGLAKRRSDGYWGQCSQRDERVCDQFCGLRGWSTCGKWVRKGTEIVGGEVVTGAVPYVVPSCNCNDLECGENCQKALKSILDMATGAIIFILVCAAFPLTA